MKEKLPCLARQKVCVATVPHLLCFGNWVGGCLEQCTEQLPSALPGEIVFCLLRLPLALALDLPLPAALHLPAVLFLLAFVSLLRVTRPLVKAFEPGRAYLQCTAVIHSPVLASDGSYSCSRNSSEPGWQALVATVGSRKLEFSQQTLAVSTTYAKSTFEIHSVVVLKVKYSEKNNVLGSIRMCAVKSLWCIYCFCFWLSLWWGRVPRSSPQHMRKLWAHCEHAVSFTQVFQLLSETQGVLFQCLPSSLCWGGGRGSRAVWGKPTLKPEMSDVLVVLTSERESLSLPQHNSNSHPLKQEFPKPFIQYNKRCKEILLLQSYHLS